MGSFGDSQMDGQTDNRIVGLGLAISHQLTFSVFSSLSLMSLLLFSSSDQRPRWQRTFYPFLPSLPFVEVARYILTTCTFISLLFLSQNLHKIAITHHLLFYSKEVDQWKVLEALWWSANDNWLPLGAAMPAADQPYNGVHKSNFQWNKHCQRHNGPRV